MRTASRGQCPLSDFFVCPTSSRQLCYRARQTRKIDSPAVFAAIHEKMIGFPPKRKAMQ